MHRKLQYSINANLSVIRNSTNQQLLILNLSTPNPVIPRNNINQLSSVSRKKSSLLISATKHVDFTWIKKADREGVKSETFFRP